MKSIIEIDSVIKSFDGRQLLTDIFMKCETGDIIGLLGRNGSGKSTLLKIMFGVERAEHQFIRADGKVLTRAFKEDNLICYLPQHDFLIGDITVYRTARLYLEHSKVEAFFEDEILDRVRHVKVSMLSGGESRYLEVKLLLNAACRFVLLDEPFNGVAPVIIEKLRALIVASAETKGITVTDHDYKNVLDIATKYYLLHDGGLKRITSKEELVRWNYLSGSNE